MSKGVPLFGVVQLGLTICLRGGVGAFLPVVMAWRGCISRVVVSAVVFPRVFPNAAYNAAKQPRNPRRFFDVAEHGYTNLLYSFLRHMRTGTIREQQKRGILDAETHQ